MLSGFSNSIISNHGIAPVQTNRSARSTDVQKPAYATSPNFKGKPAQNVEFRTTLSTKEEKEQYKHLTKQLDKEDRKLLNYALKTGKLLNDNSNDKSTVLENLYKMATTPRAEGMDTAILLKHTLQTIANPHVITQRFGDIPDEHKREVISLITNGDKNLIEQKLAEYEIDDLFSGCCVAASEEFNLASRQPAEFARFAEGLTSPKKSVEKVIKLDSLSEKALDAIWLLNAFEIPYEAKDFNTAKITLAPDKNAYIREYIQEHYQDEMERSPIDVLFQSTFMNIGSQQSYDTITDKRGGKFSNDNKGLIDFEKTFMETVVEDKSITSVTYQKVDDNQKVIGYEADYNTVKDQLLETLEKGHNIIIGYTMTDENNVINGGHEITIIGSRTDENGNLYFICNDTDDDNPAPIEYPATSLIPNIHHAGIPTEIADKTMQQTESWVLGLRDFNNEHK